MINHLNNYQKAMFKRVCSISGCDDVKQNQLAIISAIISDLNSTIERTNRGVSWRDLLQKISDILGIEDKDIANNLNHLRVYSNTQAKNLATSLNNNLSIVQMKNLKAIRGLLVLWHLDQDRKIPSILLSQLATLFNARTNDALELAGKLNPEFDDLLSLQKRIDPNDNWFRFISSVVIVLQSSEVGPPTDANINTAGIGYVNGLLNTNVQNDPNSTREPSKRKPQKIHEIGDLLSYNLSELAFLRRKDFSGVSNVYENFHQHELSQLMPGIIQTYMEGADKIILAFLCAFLFRCNVSRFNFITLEPQSGQNVWLNLDDGYLCWNRNALVKIPGVEIVNIPLPHEIVAALKQMKKRLPNAKTLGDLFNKNLYELMQKVRSFSYENTLSDHRPFHKYLHFSYGRFVLSLSADEVYSAAIAIDFSLGVKANFNYVVLEPQRINQISKAVYKALGFSGEFVSPVKTAVGSPMGLMKDKIIEVLNSQLKKAKLRFDEINNKLNLNQLINVHNQIIFSVTLLLVVLCGLRKASQYSINNHTIDIERELILVHDKASSEYLTCRLIPIPKILVDWLKFYKNWLRTLSSRLSNKKKHLSSEISTVCLSECELANIPLFFYFQRSKIKPIGSKHLQILIREYGLETNLGRHFLDRVVRDELGSALLNAHAGRANIGQESFGKRSALSLSDASKRIQQVLDKTLLKIGIEPPPELNMVRTQKALINKPYRSKAWIKNGEKKNVDELHGERCPFNEFTLIHASYFKRIVKCWLSNHVVPNLGQLALSLIISDGVIVEEEVLHGLQQLLNGNLYFINCEYFIDINSKNLGIRRINLSMVTLSLLNQVQPHYKLGNENDLYIASHAAASEVLEKIGWFHNNQPLTKLLAMAQDYYSTELPGALREWMCGRQHARTLRPEALARHKFNLKERLSHLGLIQHKKKLIRSDKAITSAIHEACDKEKDRSSNAVRMVNLGIKLKEIKDGFFSLTDEVLLDYAVYLTTKCPKIKSPNSVRTHFYVVKPLIVQICTSLNDKKDLKEFNLTETVSEFISNMDDERSISSVNYLLKMLNQKEVLSIRKDHARASRSYCDYPSDHEVTCAQKLIQENINLSQYQKQSVLILKLISHLPLRAEEIVHLRVCDVFIGEQTFFVISRAATGSNKSKNARRVLFISDKSLIEELSLLVKRRAGISQIDKDTIAVFGNADNLQSYEGTDELLFLVSNALKLATGTIFVCPHSLRSKFISRNFHQALLPQKDDFDPLNSRNALYEHSVSAGHSDVDVSVKSYLSEVNNLRRIWVDKLIFEDIKPNAYFISSITKISYDAARKRLQRNFQVQDLKNDFLLLLPPSIKGRSQDLSLLLDTENFKYELTAEKVSEDGLTLAASYLSYKLLGMTSDSAVAYLDISLEVKNYVEIGQKVFEAHKDGKLGSSLKVAFKRINQDETFVTLGKYFGAWELDPIMHAKLMKILPIRVDEDWRVSHQDVNFIIDQIEPRMARAGFVMKLFIADELDTQELVISLHKLGVKRVGKVSKRKFRKKEEMIVEFYRAQSEEQSYLRKKILNFEINIFLISLLINKSKLGQEHAN